MAARNSELSRADFQFQRRMSNPIGSRASSLNTAPTETDEFSKTDELIKTDELASV
jgi:hypothetical protein